MTYQFDPNLEKYFLGLEIMLKKKEKNTFLPKPDKRKWEYYLY